MFRVLIHLLSSPGSHRPSTNRQRDVGTRCPRLCQASVSWRTAALHHSQRCLHSGNGVSYFLLFVVVFTCVCHLSLLMSVFFVAIVIIVVDDCAFKGRIHVAGGFLSTWHWCDLFVRKMSTWSQDWEWVKLLNYSTWPSGTDGQSITETIWENRETLMALARDDERVDISI